MNPQIQAGTPIQPQGSNVNPQGVASQVPLQAPTPPVLPQGQTPVATPATVAMPNFNTSQTLGQIADYYNIPRQTAAITGAGQAQGQVAQQQFEAQKAQNEIKIQNQQNSLDPSKYQFTKNSDGTVDILNSVGDKVDIGTYAALTGANPATALQEAGATDQADQKFIAAYNNLQNYIQTKIAAQNGDQTAQAQLGDYYEANPGLQNIELGPLQNSFMQQYGQYFGQPKGNQNALAQTGQTGLQVQGARPSVNSTIASANNPVSTSAYENPNFQTEFQSNPYQQNGVSSLIAGLQSQSTGQ